MRCSSTIQPASTGAALAVIALLAGAVFAGGARETPGASEDEAPQEILSAYHGLAALGNAAVALCGPAAVGLDGMPVTFSNRIDAATLTPESFRVVTADGVEIVPVCATLAPANERLELQTVLLAGAFSLDGETPRSVEVVGPLQTQGGADLQGLSTAFVTPLDDGPSLLGAQRFAPFTPGLAGECPANTQQVIQLMWEGGVTGPQGAALDEPQRVGVHITLNNGDEVEPIALADDDNDNYVHACLDVPSPAIGVAVDPGLFFDPGDDANPETGVIVVAGTAR